MLLARIRVLGLPFWLSRNPRNFSHAWHRRSWLHKLCLSSVRNFAYYCSSPTYQHDHIWRVQTFAVLQIRALNDGSKGQREIKCLLPCPVQDWHVTDVKLAGGSFKVNKKRWSCTQNVIELLNSLPEDMDLKVVFAKGLHNLRGDQRGMWKKIHQRVLRLRGHLI